MEGSKGLMDEHIMRIKEIEMSNIQDSFKVLYSRYLHFEKSNDNSNITNISVDKKNNATFSTSTLASSYSYIVFESYLLGYFKLNFVSLSYGNEFDYDNSQKYHIPVEFVLGEDSVKNHFKFFLEYDNYKN